MTAAPAIHTTQHHQCAHTPLLHCVELCCCWRLHFDLTQLKLKSFQPFRQHVAVQLTSCRVNVLRLPVLNHLQSNLHVSRQLAAQQQRHIRPTPQARDIQLGICLEQTDYCMLCYSSRSNSYTGGFTKSSTENIPILSYPPLCYRHSQTRKGRIYIPLLWGVRPTDSGTSQRPSSRLVTLGRIWRIDTLKNWFTHCPKKFCIKPWTEVW